MREPGRAARRRRLGARDRPGAGRAVIHEVLPRRSRISRAAAGTTTEEQVLAANVDTAFIVTSLNLDLNPRRLERYVTLARTAASRRLSY